MRFTLALALCTLLAACAPPPSAPHGGGAISPNRAEVVARVLSVDLLGPQRFSLRLRVDEARGAYGEEPATRAGETVEVHPNFVRAEGQPVDYEAEPNARLLGARDLAEGSRIVAIIEHQGTSWLLHDWSPTR